MFVYFSGDARAVTSRTAIQYMIISPFEDRVVNIIVRKAMADMASGA